MHVFGASFGGGPAVMTAYILRDTVKSLTLLAPVLDYRATYTEPTHPARTAKYADFLNLAVCRGMQKDVMEGLQFNWRSALEFAMADFGTYIAHVAAITHIIHGEADNIVPFVFSEEMKRVHPDITLIAVPEMGHGYTHMDDAQGITQATRDNMDLIFRTALRRNSARYLILS